MILEAIYLCKLVVLYDDLEVSQPEPLLELLFQYFLHWCISAFERVLDHHAAWGSLPVRTRCRIRKLVFDSAKSRDQFRAIHSMQIFFLKFAWWETRSAPPDSVFGI